MKYNTAIVVQWFKTFGIDVVPEFRFAPPRKWRFDFADVERKWAIEVQGGIFSYGRHTRGAALLKEYEKLNAAARLGWRIFYVIPDDLCTMDVIEMVREAI